MADDRSADHVDLIASAIRSALADVHTAIPAKVLKFDAATKTVDVRILIKDRVVQQDNSVVAEPVPILTGVPVQYPGGRKLRLDFDLEEGDLVLLIFSERSLDAWLRTAGDTEVDPHDSRFHDRNDCFAIPGIATSTKPAASFKVAGTAYPSIGSAKGPLFVDKDGSWQVAAGMSDTLTQQKPVARQTDPVNCGTLYGFSPSGPVTFALVPHGAEPPTSGSVGVDITGAVEAPIGWTPKLKA